MQVIRNYEEVFMEYLTILIRTIICYSILVLSLRIMGKREIGQLSLFDLIILLSIADIMVIGIEKYNENFLYVILPVIMMTLLQKLVAYISLKFVSVRRVMDGSPSIIILNGKLLKDEMTKQSYNIEDLLFISLVNMTRNLTHKTSWHGVLFALFDVKYLIESKKDFNWDIVIENAQKTKTQMQMCLATGFINKIVPNLLPEKINTALKLAIKNMGEKLKGFDGNGGVLTAVESRTSSPVRITRVDDYSSVNVKNLYPCGEGCGYAGGIASAGADGKKVALKLYEKFK